MIVLDPDLDDSQPASARGALSSGRKSPASPATNHPLRADRRNRVPSVRTLAAFLKQAKTAVRLRGEVTVLLTSDPAIKGLNRRFRGKNKPTDVLSFPAPPELASQVAGDLAISVPTARRQAQEQGHRLSAEIKILILHGLLHLAGFDHEVDTGQMARRERSLRTRLRLPQGLIERVEESEPPTATKRAVKQPASGRRRS